MVTSPVVSPSKHPLSLAERLVQPRRFKLGFTVFFCAMHLLMLQGLFFFSWGAVITSVAIYLLAAFGLSAGFHRGLCHSSFRASRWFMYLLVTLGSLQLVGGPVSWVGMHHIHHKYSDTDLDPHSSKKGFWWAHIGWAFFSTQNFYREHAQKTLREDFYYKMIDILFMLPQVVLGVILYYFGGWTYVVWGVFMRIPLHWHATFSVNSVTHWFGYKNYTVGPDDRSRNNWWVAILTLGEGWHNNHHHDKRAAYYGRRWWEIDVVGFVIWLFEKLRLVRNVVLPREKGGMHGNNPSHIRTVTSGD